jgi:hypothetical protein
MFREDGSPFYIGKGSGRRVLNHEKEAGRGVKSIKCAIIRRMLAAGVEIPLVFIREGISEAEAFETEVALIKVLGRIDLRTGCLANMTDGGDGVSGASPEVNYKKGSALRGKPLTNEHKAHIGAGNLGKRRTPEAKAKMSAKKIGHIPSNLAELAAGNIGRPCLAETRAKIGASNRGKVRSPEICAKMSAIIRAAWVLKKAKIHEQHNYPEAAD